MRAILLIALVLAFATSLRAADALELARLRAAYDVAVGNAARPVIQEHIAALGKLRDASMRSSNLDAANKVQGEMDRAAAAMAKGEPTPPAADASIGAVPELDKLRATHAAAMERALKPLRDTYVRELEKLRDFYARSANLDGANAAQTELTAINSGAAVNPSAAGSSKPTAAELQTSGKQPRLSGKAPKSEWYMDKTWVSEKGSQWTFAKGGGGEVVIDGNKSPLAWEIVSSGLLKATGKGQGSTLTTWHVHFLSPVEAFYGSASKQDKIMRLKQ